MIADDLIARQVQLLRLSAGERAKVYRILRTMEEELVDKLQKSNLADISREDKARLLKQAQALIAQYYGEISDEVGKTLGEVGRLEASATAASLGTIYAGAIAPSIPPEGVLKRLVDNTLIEGAPSAEWWKRQSGDLQFRFKNAVAQGLAAAETNDEIIRRVRGRANGYTVIEGKRVYNYVGGIMDIARHHAAAQVQTSVMTVAAQARQDTYDANDDIIKGYRQLSTLDSHVTPVCLAYSGATWDKNKQPSGTNKRPFVSPKGSANGVPRHWNCFPGATLVTTRGDVTGVTRRLFDGDVVVINTASGRNVTCTPNHPILTDRGWVAAGLLNESSYVICDGGREWGGLVNRNSQDVPTPIHDFTESWLRARQVVAMPVPLSPEDFHGDGGGSKVAVVFSNRLLRNGLDSSGAQHFSKLKFIARLATVAAKFIGERHSFGFSIGSGAASHSGIGRADKLAAFFRRSARHACELLLAAIARRDASFAEHALKSKRGASELLADADQTNAGIEEGARLSQVNVHPAPAAHRSVGGLQVAEDDIAAATERGRNFLHGFTGSVFADNVVSVEFKSFHGEVFNLETEGGWYTAEGIITHNCRSVILPETKTFRELGLDVDEVPGSVRAASGGPVAADMTMEGFIKKKGDKFANDLLGEGRAQLYLDGKITLQQLVDQSGRPLTLKQLRRLYN